jgi:hypothetical protein
MEHDQLVGIERQLQDIAELLLLHGTLTDCPGLVHGKIGIAVFFFHYAQFTNNMLFADYAMDLIGEVQNQIHANSPADYEKGIAGIGVGIDYLIRNNFLCAEDDICEDLDNRMFRAVMYDPWQNFSLYEGLIGYGMYWISRLRYQEALIHSKECLLQIIERIIEKLPDIPVRELTDVYCFLHDLHKISGFESCNGLLEKLSADTILSFSRLGDSAIGNIIRMCLQSRYFNVIFQDEIDCTLQQITDLDFEKAPTALGLFPGYAGEGLLRLMMLDSTNISWMQLL